MAGDWSDLTEISNPVGGRLELMDFLIFQNQGLSQNCSVNN